MLKHTRWYNDEFQAVIVVNERGIVVDMYYDYIDKA